MGKVGRPRKEQALTRLADVVAPIAERALEPARILPHTQSNPGSRVGGDHGVVVTSGKAEQVVWLKLCAWPNRQIGDRLGLHPDSIDRYVKSPHFFALYEARKAELLGRVLEEMQGRLLEVGLEALQIRVDMMRSAKSAWLRDKIAKELVELALEIGKARGPSGEVADKLVAVIERIKKRRLADGTTEIQKIRVTGGAGEAAEALAAEVGKAVGVPAAADEGGSGDPAGADNGSDQAQRADSPGEDSSGA